MALDLKKIRKALLSEHNKARALHGADSLKSNSELESQAQKWAEHMATQNRLQHSTNSYKGNPVGENVFGAYNSAKTPDDIALGATANWYSEIEHFDYLKPEEKLSGCGHFTQVIWKASKEVGFGAARSSDGHVYVVGQYFPAGNFIGHVGENVKPAKDGKRPDFIETRTVPTSAIGTNLPSQNLGEPVKKETKREVKEEVVDGKRVRKTITTEINTFADGTQRTTTRTQTETFS